MPRDMNISIVVAAGRQKVQLTIKLVMLVISILANINYYCYIAAGLCYEILSARHNNIY